MRDEHVNRFRGGGDDDGAGGIDIVVLLSLLYYYCYMTCSLFYKEPKRKGDRYCALYTTPYNILHVQVFERDTGRRGTADKKQKDRSQL